MEFLRFLLALIIGAVAVCVGFYIASRIKTRGVTALDPSATRHAIEDVPGAANSMLFTRDIDDPPVLTIMRLVDSPQNLEPVQVSSETKNSLGRLLQHAPRAIIGAAETGVAMANTYAVVFRPKTMLQLANGTLEMMPAEGGGLRAIARNGYGIVEHGRLVSVTGVVTTCAVWQVLAIATAQKFLSDINQRLKSVDTKLERIEKWLQHERYGALKANLAYVEDILSVILSGKIQPADIPIFRAELEGIERESSRLTYASQADSSVPISEAAGVQLSTFWTAPNLDRSLELIEYFDTTARFQLMATHVRLAATRVGDALGSDEQMGWQRTKRVREQLQAFDTFATEFSRRIEEKISSVNVKIDPFDKTEQTRQRLRHNLQARLQELQEYKEQLLNEVTAIDAQFERGQDPVRLIVEVCENGGVKQISRMLPDDTLAAAAGTIAH